MLLFPRLKPDHHKISQLEREISSYMSGYRGEKATEFDLTILDDKKYRLPHEQHSFQINTPILTRKYILILENKPRVIEPKLALLNGVLFHLRNPFAVTLKEKGVFPS
jgi:hypothetical protein